MGGGMSMVIPGVYVGGVSSVKAKSQLKEFNITHICTVLHYELRVEECKQKIFLADDSPTQNLSKYFRDACFFIHEARVSNGGVLIHCACGISRSVTITLAYLMTITGLPLADLYKAVQGARPCACPNYGFVEQLYEFAESGGPSKIKSELIDHFGEWPKEKFDADISQINQHLIAYEYFTEHGVYPGEKPLLTNESKQNDSVTSNENKDNDNNNNNNTDQISANKESKLPGLYTIRNDIKSVRNLNLINGKYITTSSSSNTNNPISPTINPDLN